MKKKSFYKKWWFWAIVIFILFVFVVGVSDSEEPVNSTTNQGASIAEAADAEATNELTKTEAAQEVPTKKLTEKEKIEILIKNRIKDKYTFTTIDKIILNEDLGTDAEGDYVALVYLTWEQQNSGERSKEVLKMYSDDLAATMAEKCDSLQEIAVFWTVPYLNDASAKCSYERRGEKMIISDFIFDKNFN